jgi:hypothetical protein
VPSPAPGSSPGRSVELLAKRTRSLVRGGLVPPLTVDKAGS